MKDLLENIQGYIQTNIEIAKLEIQEKIDFAIQKGIKIGGLILMGTLSIVFLLIFVSLLISLLLDSYVFGFGIVTFILIIITAIIFYSFKKNSSQN